MIKSNSCKTNRNTLSKGAFLPSQPNELQRHSKAPQPLESLNLNLTVSLISDDNFQNDPHFFQRASYLRTSAVVAGAQCGDTSSASTTLLSENCKGIKVVIAKSYNTLFKQQLLNAGILPLEFIHPDDYDKISLYDTLYLEQLEAALKPDAWMIYNRSSEEFYEAVFKPVRRNAARIGFETAMTIG